MSVPPSDPGQLNSGGFQPSLSPDGETPYVDGGLPQPGFGSPQADSGLPQFLPPGVAPDPGPQQPPDVTPQQPVNATQQPSADTPMAPGYARPLGGPPTAVGYASPPPDGQQQLGYTPFVPFPQPPYPQQPAYPQQAPYPQQPAYPQQPPYAQQPPYPQQPYQAPYPYQQYANLPDPYAQSPYPPTPPKQSHTARTALIVCLIAVVVVALVAIFINNASTGPTPTPQPAPTSKSMPTASPIPGNGVPIDVAYTTVVEAIDLSSQPSLGTAWNASDGDPGAEDLDPQFFVTPCGVLVTTLTSDFDSPGQGARARLVGYEISTGTKAWTVPLQQATGLNDPVPWYDPPTYTSDCSMVLTFRDMDFDVDTMVAVMIDLSTGATTPFSSSEDLRSCVATGPGQAACWGWEDMTLFDVARGTHQSTPVSVNEARYNESGDIVVDGLVWSEEGYIDPATSDVVFGSDVHAPGWDEDEDADWVVYKEPLRPGGYRSGLAVRVEGPLDSYDGTCWITLWDVQSDAGSWAQPASIPCGSDTYYNWNVTESALVANNDMDESVRAYSLADGTPLWEKQDGHLSSTSWNRANDAETIRGLTGDFAVFFSQSYSDDIVRIADGGTVTAFPEDSWDLVTLSPTMAYATGYRSGESLAGFAVDGSGTPLWTLVLPDGAYNIWTFATGGTMYVVSDGYQSPTTISPLIP